MRRFNPFLIFILLAPLFLFAQTYEVSGTVKDGENAVVPYANVFLLRVNDSMIVKGSSANENGLFSIENVEQNTYYIKASYIGQTSKPVAIDVSKDVSIGSLIIVDNVESLDEVIVTSKRPTVQRTADKVVFHVENTIVSQGSSWDILRRTPGVIMVQDNLKIGNQTPTIYLNDRKVQLSQSEIRDLLMGFSGVNIKSVEVIRNPPARYDAEGGPVLNIVTSKSVTPGYKGSVNGNNTQAIFPKYSLGTSHYFKGKKLNVFANYSINPRKENKDTEIVINYLDNSNTVFSILDTDYNRITKSLSQNANLILDYDFDERNALNFTTNLSYSPNKTFKNRMEGEIYNGQNVLDSTLRTISDLENDTYNLAFDLTYRHKLKKEGASLEINGHFTKYNEEQVQDVSTNYFDASNNFTRNFSFNTDSAQDIEILTGQVDYITPIGNTNFESGVKASHINSMSGIDFFDIMGFNQTFDSNLSDDFKYNEVVLAGYASILKNWEKWTLKAGIRGEYTDVEARSLSTNTTNLQNYFELFPSTYILFTPSDDHSFSFDYSRRLDRPRYNDLNPFRYFLYENDFVDGNPGLRPYFTHNFKLNYTLKGDYFFDVYYRDNGNYISTLSFQDNENQNLRTIKQNVIKSTSYGVDFVVSKSILNKWFLYGYTSIYHEDETFLAVESNNVEATNEIKGIYVSITNYLTLSKDNSLTGEVGFNYSSRYLFGSYVLSETSSINLGLRKNLWNNRASVSVVAQDIFGNSFADYTSRYLNQNNIFSPRSEWQFVRFGFTYNFGNFKLKDNQRNIDKNERDRL